MKAKGMKDNKGFTIVELMISVAILSIVLAMMAAVIHISTRQFVKGNANAGVQKEARSVINQIEEMLIETNGGVFYKEETGVHSLQVYNAVTEGGTTSYYKELFQWKDSLDTIRYSKWNVNFDSTTGAYSIGTPVYADQLLAEDITDFTVDVSDRVVEWYKDGVAVESVSSLSVGMKYVAQDGQISYIATPVISLRNRVLHSEDLTLIFTNIL